MKREFHVRYLAGDLSQTERQFQTEALARDFMEKCKRPILDAWVTAPVPIPTRAIRQCSAAGMDEGLKAIFAGRADPS